MEVEDYKVRFVFKTQLFEIFYNFIQYKYIQYTFIQICINAEISTVYGTYTFEVIDTDQAKNLM